MKAKFKSKQQAGRVAIERKKRELDERRTALEGLHVTQRQIIGSQSDRIETQLIEMRSLREQRDKWLSRWQVQDLAYNELEAYAKRLEGEKANLSDTSTMQTSRIRVLTTGLEDYRQELNMAHAFLKDTQHKLSKTINDKQYFQQRTREVSRELSKVGRDLDRAKTRTITCTIWAAGGWLLALGYFGAYLGLWG